MTRSGRQKQQAGFSLVEIMVALVIGLFVLAGVGSVYITGKRTYKARDGLSILQENGRVAIKLIEQGVSRAGYPTFAQIEPVIHNESQLDQLQLKDGKQAGTLGIKPSDKGVGGESDVLTVEYQPVKGGAYEEASDCVGNKSKIIDRVVSSYYVDGGVLKCHGSGKKTPEPIAENIEAMQVEYGIDGDGDGFADRYQPIPGLADWENVVSIRVILLVASSDDVLEKLPAETREFILAGEKITVPANKKIYRVFSTTIPLRNKTPIL